MINLRNLDFKDIQNFYDCYQEQIGTGIASKLTEQEIDEICDKAIDKINDARQTSKHIINTFKGNPQLQSISFPAILTLLLDQNCLTQILKITTEREKHECGLRYDNKNTENQMWAWAIFFMSWTVRNLKGKVEVGHCWNPNHRLRDDKVTCPQGSKFHLDFYNDCLQSFKDIIKSAELNTPIPTYYLLSRHYQNNPDQLPKLIRSILKAL